MSSTDIVLFRKVNNFKNNNDNNYFLFSKILFYNHIIYSFSSEGHRAYCCDSFIENKHTRSLCFVIKQSHNDIHFDDFYLFNITTIFFLWFSLFTYCLKTRYECGINGAVPRSLKWRRRSAHRITYDMSSYAVPHFLSYIIATSH